MMNENLINHHIGYAGRFYQKPFRKKEIFLWKNKKNEVNGEERVIRFVYIKSKIFINIYFSNYYC